MKMFWQRNQIINELRGQIVFAEITVNFLCINIGAVHDVGTSKEQRQGARHGGGCHAGTQRFQVLLGLLTPLPVPWDTSSSVGTLVSQMPPRGHKPCGSHVAGCTPRTGAKCKQG